MGRTNKKAARKPAKKEKATSATATDVPSLLDKANVLLAQSNFELAIKFLERALELEPANPEARELAGVAELEGGDVDRGREHLLRLFPPHAPANPDTPSPYLYLAQTAEGPEEALGYYSTATAMIENLLKGKGRAGEIDETELRKMAITAIVAMIEIWMSDLCFEDAASSNCDGLIARALSISPNDPEALMTLASIRMSQSKFVEAKEVVLRLYRDMEGRDPFDPMLPPLPVRLQFTRLLLEHGLHMEALDVITTGREEDSLEVESAYLEGWTWHLRADALEEAPPQNWADMDDDEEPMNADECYAESLRALLEAAKLFTEQEYPDEGIGSHLQELIQGLQKRGVKPAVHAVEDEEEEDGDVDMA
ncbi:hypothetical protein CC85DRAFT_287636 [Cutaneotrichosporon oleaginosum]|uniref:Uncharacterized protein n=1 Tax=Cutaneotrichosporon oleaginosum TaxID=879819 RepID=A0A0J0XGW9_9TREE|nr:uncharacterized protein CC85DRAFT_287636 [Cutaneotrichosporon oleaginosum]KLT40311.1 hypothetical protein CC85DRAFT_287636 [Cutaneotrichosporon oleaginosum]TXT07977.1 hypothetical protein COLE_04901 [Cutaneotrichosporon oleaginosum]